MCLSNVYLEENGEQTLVFKEAATVSRNGNELTFTNILGIPKSFEGQIEKIDFLENKIIIKKNEK